MYYVTPVETEGMVPRLHKAVHFQTLKAVIQNNSYQKQKQKKSTNLPSTKRTSSHSVVKNGRALAKLWMASRYTSRRYTLCSDEFLLLAYCNKVWQKLRGSSSKMRPQTPPAPSALSPVATNTIGGPELPAPEMQGDDPEPWTLFRLLLGLPLPLEPQRRP